MPAGKDVGGGRRGGTTKKNAFCSFCRKSYRDVGIGNGEFRLLPHAAFKRIVRDVFQPSRVDEGKRHARAFGFAFPPITGNAWRVINEREFLARQPVKKG